MKIKLMTGYGSAKPGEEYHAVLSKDGKRAVFFDSDDCYWSILDHEFVLVQPDYSTFTHHETETSGAIPTILDVLGGDVKKLQLDVEFK